MHDGIVTASRSVEGLVEAIVGTLTRSGFRVQRSMHMESACAPEGTACPHHGEGRCACEMEALTIYDWRLRAHGLIVHVGGGTGQVRFATPAETGDDARFREMLRLVLEADLGRSTATARRANS